MKSALKSSISWSKKAGKKSTLIAFASNNKDLCRVLEFYDQSSLTASYVPIQQDESKPNYLWLKTGV